MKKIYFILGLALLVITGCMVIIFSRGVSLRTEPIIKPSPLDTKHENIVYGITHRLFPDFQQADYVIWGIDATVYPEEDEIIHLLQNNYLNKFGKKVSLLKVDTSTTADEIKNCLNPCWYIVARDQAHNLSENNLVSSIKSIKGMNTFSITFLEFERDIPVPEFCENQHRLSFECIMPVSVREARRFLKKLEVRSFFMRRYNTVDYFLFVEKQ